MRSTTSGLYLISSMLEITLHTKMMTQCKEKRKRKRLKKLSILNLDLMMMNNSSICRFKLNQVCIINTPKTVYRDKKLIWIILKIGRRSNQQLNKVARGLILQSKIWIVYSKKLLIYRKKKNNDILTGNIVSMVENMSSLQAGSTA